MWAANLTQSLQKVGEVESRIALEIARRFRSELTPADQRRLNKAVHPNAEAYSLLLRGRYEMSLYTPESGQRAASYFEQALGVDPATPSRMPSSQMRIAFLPYPESSSRPRPFSAASRQLPKRRNRRRTS